MLRTLKTRLKHILSPKYAYLRRFNMRSGDLVIDLGANVGEVSEYFLEKGAVVHAYEPNPHAFEILRKRTAKRRNLTLHPVAVSNFAGVSKLYLHQQHAESEVQYSQGGSLKAEKDNLCADYIEVSVEDIKSVLARHERIRLLKIDIEGGEYDIMDEVLEQIEKIDYVLLETHGHKSASFREKDHALSERIRQMNVADKIFTDWF